MGENHFSSGKKKKSSYFQFSAQRVPEVTNTRSFSLGYNSSYFKPCYGHEATLSCHGSLCLRTCPSVTAQIKEQKSPSDQLGWGGTSPGEDKGRVTGSLVSCCHVCWQPQPQPGTLGCTAVKGLYIGDPQGRQLAQQMGLSRSHHPPPPWSRAEDTSYTPANVSPFSPCSLPAGWQCTLASLLLPFEDKAWCRPGFHLTGPPAREATTVLAHPQRSNLLAPLLMKLKKHRLPRGQRAAACLIRNLPCRLNAIFLEEFPLGILIIYFLCLWLISA